MKKFLLTFIFCICLLSLFGCKRQGPLINNKEIEVNKYVLAEEQACFNFFWETQNTNELLGGCGLIPDRYPSSGLASIASVGFGLASFVVGAKNNWVTKEEAEQRAYLTLSKMKDMPRIEGFYYHFYNEKKGNPSSGSEISNIDTSLFLCGAIVASEYFQGEVKRLFTEIYDEVNWQWFINKNTNNFYMSYNPTTKSFSGAWDVYGEQLIMYFLGAGANKYPIEKVVYDSFKRNTGSYKGKNFINSWFGSIFTYQYSHAFIDFRNIVDDKGINWFENSVEASLANYNYCIDQAVNFQTFSDKSWGLTACDTPTGYSGLLGALPSGAGYMTFKNDGTVAPCGAIGSIAFTPKEAIKAINYYSTVLNGELIGDYGFFDAFNFDGGQIWIAKSVIGIDKGISLLMIENYRSNLIWEYFMKNESIQRAINVLGFKESA